MANALYDTGRDAFLQGGINWVTDDIRALLVRTSGGQTGPYYTVNLATDDFLNDIPNNADCRPVAAVAMTTSSAGAGVADATDITFTSVPAGDAIQVIVLYDHTGVESTSQLIAYIDTGTGLPVTPNGNNIDVTWDSGANRIFKL